MIDAEQADVPVRGGSRFNAVKHRLFARSAVLPGEDLEEFQARVEMYREGLNPRNDLQEDDPCDPDQPERLILQLEQTAAGCRLLLRHWGELRGLLERGGGWQSREKLVVSRLLGMQPMNVVHKHELAKIFLACHVIEPQFQSPFRELRCELDENSYNR